MKRTYFLYAGIDVNEASKMTRTDLDPKDFVSRGQYATNTTKSH